MSRWRLNDARDLGRWGLDKADEFTRSSSKLRATSPTPRCPWGCDRSPSRANDFEPLSFALAYSTVTLAAETGSCDQAMAVGPEQRVKALELGAFHRIFASRFFVTL
ncbi:MAG: hypothetical protein R3E60_03385 [Alphaproteobacteria bacterium]